MGFRRKAREFALQMLYQFDFNREKNLQELLDEFWAEREISPDIQPFCNRLVEGTLSVLDDLDSRIRSCAENWSLERISVVDRNILRIAIFELLYVDDVPVRVTLNEAIEIAKKFGQEESPAFVNGILDRIVRENKDRLSKKMAMRSP
jgi:N utilization substance protein B